MTDHDTNNKTATVTANKSLDKAGEPETASVGVDIGTSKIVIARKKNGHIDYASHRNAFISVEHSNFTEKILNQNQIRHHQIGNSLIVYRSLRSYSRQ